MCKRECHCALEFSPHIFDSAVSAWEREPWISILISTFLFIHSVVAGLTHKLKEAANVQCADVIGNSESSSFVL